MGLLRLVKKEQVLATPSTGNGDIEEKSIRNGDIEEKSIRISWQPCKVDRIRIYTEDASYDETIELSERKTLLMMKLLNFRKLI